MLSIVIKFRNIVALENIRIKVCRFFLVTDPANNVKKKLEDVKDSNSLIQSPVKDFFIPHANVKMYVHIIFHINKK